MISQTAFKGGKLTESRTFTVTSAIFMLTTEETQRYISSARPEGGVQGTVGRCPAPVKGERVDSGAPWMCRSTCCREGYRGTRHNAYLLGNDMGQQRPGRTCRNRLSARAEKH